MSKIQDKFSELRLKNEKALIAYVMCGYPNERDSISSLRGLVKGGADIIEIGFPFSDPIADGPVIQNASNISLNHGTNLEKFLKILRKIRKETNIPLVLMTYTNILYQKGFDKIFPILKKNGIDGIILPDMSVEESEDYVKSAKKNKMDTIFLISPNTKTERIKKISKVTSGFLYLVSIYGTTGTKSGIKQYTIDAVRKTKNTTKGKIPIGIGFGIYTPNDVKRFISIGVDAVIVGSAFMKIIEKTSSNQIENKVMQFTLQMKKATKKH